MRPVPERKDWMGCGVCGRVLERVTNNAGETVEWRHPADIRLHDEDHPVVPVLLTELRTNLKCDFCLAPDPQWELPAESFTMFGPNSDIPAVQEQNSVNEWAACDICADLIRRDRWGLLTKRAIEHFEALHGRLSPGEDEVFHILYANLRRYATGPIRPITD